ncbi:hypothetical protein KUTeg_012570 [Tegillarca granosa]|uniref:Uncharacterized protein n=1 Tax=Tegillarca granosa TaxID=220873 RepID=A0ABQ9F3H7_TEGGR|nr:hypothetical protein KUTeg_012570 [Tegillarca granosa]
MSFSKVEVPTNNVEVPVKGRGFQRGRVTGARKRQKYSPNLEREFIEPVDYQQGENYDGWSGQYDSRRYDEREMGYGDNFNQKERWKNKISQN